jgi:hypothetical protein
MFGSAQVRMVGLALSVAALCATVSAGASAGQVSLDQDDGLPLTPPPLTTSNEAGEARQSGSLGTVFFALAGPVGLALGGLNVAAAAENPASPLNRSSRFRAAAPTFERGPTGAPE